MRGLNLSTKHQEKEKIFEILFDDWVYFSYLFRDQTEWPPLLR